MNWCSILMILRKNRGLRTVYNCGCLSKTIGVIIGTIGWIAPCTHSALFSFFLFVFFLIKIKGQNFFILHLKRLYTIIYYQNLLHNRPLLLHYLLWKCYIISDFLLQSIYPPIVFLRSDIRLADLDWNLFTWMKEFTEYITIYFLILTFMYSE